MELETSPSTARRLPLVEARRVNDHCTLRRNVAVQPYARCTVCTLELKQCHAWQSSALSFALVILLLVPLFAHEAWMLRASVAGALVLLIVQGMLNHARTDQLIFGQHHLSRTSEQLRDRNAELLEVRAGLEREVAARTERLRQTNVALAQANLELVEIARGREAMLLEVSHDLRTPLTSIQGASDNLLDGIAGALSSDQRDYVQIVRSHAERLLGAVSRLLQAAREQRIHVALQLLPVDVDALVRDVVRSLEPIARERGLSLEVCGTPVETLADPEKLRKVLENLVGNALKFTDTGGSVRVALEHDASDLRILVQDTGVGMTAEDLERVFVPFYRGRDDRPGSGLGLAITRDLVRLHGGDVLAESVPGQGSRFSAILPRRAA